MFDPLNPKHHIDIIRNNLRISNCSAISSITSCTELMQPLHKTQLLNVKGKHYNNGYITRTEFTQLKSIFERYKNEILNKDPGNEEYVGNVLGMYTELNSFENELNEQSKKLSQHVTGYHGNGEIRRRSEA